MDEKKPEDTMPEVDTPAVENTPEVTTSMPEVEEVPQAETEVEVNNAVPADSAMAPARSFNTKAYAGMVLIILIMCAGLLFVLEKEGRTSTGVFDGVITKMNASKSAASVNGVDIYQSDLDSSLQQLTNMTAQQGADVSDPAVIDGLRQQAIDTLVNAEVLRQAAVEAGITVTPEQVETRFSEIKDGIGGEEALAQKMTEFGVTEAGLRKDIENEFLIQGLFDVKVDSSSIVVTEEEITALYDQAGGVEAGLPPFAEVKEQIDAQIKFDKEQKLISELVDSLRAEADVKINI